MEKIHIYNIKYKMKILLLSFVTILALNINLAAEGISAEMIDVPWLGG